MQRDGGWSRGVGGGARGGGRVIAGGCCRSEKDDGVEL